MSFFLPFRFTGDQPKDVRIKIREASKRYSKGAEWGIYAAMSDIIALAERNAPRQSGALAASGYVTRPRRGEVEGGFGGPSDPYVISVNRRTHFFTRAIDGSSPASLLETARIAVVDFVDSDIKPKRIRPTTPHNSKSRAAAASKGGP